MDRIDIPRPLYEYLVTESRGLCNYCHRATFDEVHHIIPVEKGGSNEYDNLIPLCGSCHSKIHKTAYSPAKLRDAKEKWVCECRDVIARIVADAGSTTERVSRLVDSFDAVDNVVEFKGLHNRFAILQERKALFQNLFRVHDHRILINVDDEGNAEVAESQRWSSFAPFGKREYHIEGSTPCPTFVVDFKATARYRNRVLPTRVEVNNDHPTYKSFTLLFAKAVPAGQPVTVVTNYYWPRVWNLSADRYTYDVLGWAKRVEYTMRFPPGVRVQTVNDSYIDILGSEWKSIGNVRINENSFTWLGSHLPLFSSVIINYTTASMGDSGM